MSNKDLFTAILLALLAGGEVHVNDVVGTTRWVFNKAKRELENL